MLPAITGHLLSGAFIQTKLPAFEIPADIDRIRRTLVAWRARCALLGPASTPRALMQAAAAPLCAALGFDPPAAIEAADPGVAATLCARGRAVALLVTPWGEALDPLWRLAITHAVKRGAPWCLVFDGLRLRIVDAGRIYGRRHLEFDLDLALDQPDTLAALVAIAGAAALSFEIGDQRSLHALVAASDRHAAGVCRSLRDGVLAASGELLAALAVRQRPPRLDIAFEQALTIVYRMLFLLFAEARALVPVWHPIYRESYSLEALRDIAEGTPPASGVWEALRAIARLAHSGCRAGDLWVTPFNGRLFAPARTPLAERGDLDDDAARRAVTALSTRPAADRAGRERIAYRDLGVEQLGAVYETLLDYQPRNDGRRVTLETGLGLRKATGTFYTPQCIADYVVRRTLGPLVADAAPDEILELRVVDPAMGSGAFLVAACRYLASAYEAALIRCGRCHSSDIGEVERGAIRRTIAERCLYGVDLNPMAVQLARLSLWLATLAADKPLSFLDHRLQVGDSLLGTWVSALRRPPAVGRRGAAAKPMPLFDDEPLQAALQQVVPVRFALEAMPGDTIEQVKEKEKTFTALTARSAALWRWKRIADLWCAPWFAPDGDGTPASAFGALSDRILCGRCALPEKVASRYLAAADEASRSRRLFHWELEFPEVFFDREGTRLPRAGFDAVIGNPPWDMIRADAGEAGLRSQARGGIAQTLRFTRDSGVYHSQSDGHANRYQLFVERAIALTRRGGRFGLVLPSGLALDHGSAPLRRRLFSQCDVDAVVGMENRRGVFPIHRSVGFLLLTATQGAPTQRIACRLGVEDPTALESIGDEPAATSQWFPVRAAPALLQRLYGADMVLPRLLTPTDVAIADRAASLFPPLGGAAGWSARFGRELNASDDRSAFREGGNGLPIVDGKHVEPFHAAIDRVERTIGGADARRLLRADRHTHPRLAYRDVASATNRLTLIAAVLPGGCVSTHTVFCLRTPLPLRDQHFLCGLFNSFVLNYLVRLRVTTHVTTAAVEQLPVPTTESAPSAAREIGALARHLARRRDRAALAALNARVAELYQLSAGEFEHILDTFPLIAAGERQEALNVFRGEK
jgi:Eco57I restriction-modification methylase